MEDLDSLLSDLEKATVHLKQSQTMSSPQSPGSTLERPGSANYSKITREYNYSSKGAGDPPEPVYQNERFPRNMKSITSNGKPSANLSELDTLLDDLDTARHQPTSFENSRTETFDNGIHKTTERTVYTGREKADSAQVNALISNLERDLAHPEAALKYRGNLIKPVIMTEYYAEETTTTEVKPLTATSSPQHAIYAVPEKKAPPPAAASNATRELDDLMDSLSDFKVKDRVNDYEYGKIQQKPVETKQPLDSMLGNLQSDLSKQGVDTTAKGHCFACHKPIVGQVVTALGRTWHPEHFTCVHCNAELGTQNFFERNGEPYCEHDYHNLFSPRCAYCNGSILDKCVTALDNTWHPEHFFCTVCGKQFDDDGYHEKDGKPYCRDDYFDLYAPKCGGCNKPITENYISALNTQWHPDCFVCAECRCPFVGGSFFDLDGLPYCETHYHLKRGSLCAGCHKPITGRCITAMYRKFHPEHFVCSFCLNVLNKGTFKEQNDKPYCHPCFEKLFG